MSVDFALRDRSVVLRLTGRQHATRKTLAELLHETCNAMRLYDVDVDAVEPPGAHPLPHLGVEALLLGCEEGGRVGVRRRLEDAGRLVVPVDPREKPTWVTIPSGEPEDPAVEQLVSTGSAPRACLSTTPPARPSTRAA